MRNGDENADDIAGRFSGTYTGTDARSCKYGTTSEITDKKGKGLPESGKGEVQGIPHSPEKDPVSCLTDGHYTICRVFFNVHYAFDISDSYFTNVRFEPV
jgi:hypothetical protein